MTTRDHIVAAADGLFYRQGFEHTSFSDIADMKATGWQQHAAGRVRHREFAMASGEMSEAEFTKFLEDVFRQLALHTVDGSIHRIAWIGGTCPRCWRPAARFTPN